MTRFCIQCDRIIGEKCVQCGTEVTNSNGHAVTNAEFDCPSCGHHFLQGDGGETGGLCTPCLEAELQSAHEQAAKNPAKTKETLIVRTVNTKTFSRLKEDSVGVMQCIRNI